MTLTVAVRTLCAFTARRGDLDRRFTPAPSAQEGMAGHALVTGRRGADYQRELPLEGRHGELVVRGRADGFDPARRRLEEIKTHRGDLALMPDNQRALHWAQVKLYGALLCRERGHAELTLALVYLDIATQRETALEATFEAAELEAFLVEHCARFLAWARQEAAHRVARDAALEALGFPHAAFRPGQRELAEATYKAAATGRALLLEAPTGIGKTLGTLFPALKALPRRRLDRVFFLTAKTPGRRLALDALATLAGDGAEVSAMPLRVLELVARDKACEHPDKACHGEACPLARGFYDRLPAAREAAVRHARLDRERVREIALAHDVCPYYLAQELARWCDVVVGDYNYYFDAHAMLHALAREQEWRVAVLVDEAHNLVERGRGMYTAELDRAELLALKRHVPGALRRPLEALDRQWRALHADDEADAAYRVLDGPPTQWLGALQRLVQAIADHLAEAAAAGTPMADPALLAFMLDALQLVRLTERFGAHSLFDCHERPGRRGTRLSRLCCRNVLPAAFLAERFAAAHAAVLFSATLGPGAYYRDLLGLPADTPWQAVLSPFSAAQLTVRRSAHISTRYADRPASLTPIATLMAEQYRARPGNYLAFFSSHAYLEQVAGRFREHHPEVPVWCQQRRMDEAARQAFLDRFVADGRGIGFAVLGGAFAEGVDLPGERLIGAFVVTLGLPQVNPVTEQLRERLAALFGRGYDYAYLYPGVQKVVQAAGRVIRTPADRGVVHLIDDRFCRREVERLLPAWWRLDPGGG
ncbi:ATP-dependent DNA helicase [Modicisalibacter tunisiensis]|uniref:ATP-dependent DNA helicase n=1 Tax=Modicisalibacter tunisiensis TaxID=390637 RepID=A0ABS7WW94_9GAMM|nr:ATP-dependent DNA helicase [Modicisalibacter tunisiensis]MBZ9566444.1 ATP-dependent DNA helicase [Modicisalibacter tunisiensis]